MPSSQSFAWLVLLTTCYCKGRATNGARNRCTAILARMVASRLGLSRNRVFLDGARFVRIAPAAAQLRDRTREETMHREKNCVPVFPPQTKKAGWPFRATPL